MDDVAGRDGWIIERTGVFVDETGMPVLIGRMNILGVVKEALGYGKAHEKWQGTRIENAEADLMKNLAEAHGVGRYLDNQQQTIEHIWKNAKDDPQVMAMARKLAVQYNLQLKAQIEEDNAIAEGKDIPVPKPRVEKANLLEAMSAPPAKSSKLSLYPRHNTVVKQVRTLTGHDGAAVVSYCNKYGAQAPEQLSPELLEKLLASLAMDWAKDKFQDEKLAMTSYQGKVGVLTAAGVSLGDAIASWIESVGTSVR